MKCLPPPRHCSKQSFSWFWNVSPRQNARSQKGQPRSTSPRRSVFFKNENYIFRRGQTVFLTHTCKNEHFASTRCVFWLNTTQCLTRFLLFRVYGFRLAETQVPAGTSQEHQPAGTRLYDFREKSYVLHLTNGKHQPAGTCL